MSSVQLMLGVAAHLDARGVGVWREAGGYTSGETPIVLRAFPSAPDRGIALATYAIDDDPTLSDSVTGLQVRTRGTKDPRVVDDIADAVFDELQNLRDVTLGTVRIVQIRRTSSAPLGADGNGRWERVDNYRVDHHRPSPHRT